MDIKGNNESSPNNFISLGDLADLPEDFKYDSTDSVDSGSDITIADELESWEMVAEDTPDLTESMISSGSRAISERVSQATNLAASGLYGVAGAATNASSFVASGVWGLASGAYSLLPSMRKDDSAVILSKDDPAAIALVDTVQIYLKEDLHNKDALIDENTGISKAFLSDINRTRMLFKKNNEKETRSDKLGLTLSLNEGKTRQWKQGDPDRAQKNDIAEDLRTWISEQEGDKDINYALLKQALKITHQGIQGAATQAYFGNNDIPKIDYEPGGASGTGYTISISNGVLNLQFSDIRENLAMVRHIDKNGEPAPLSTKKDDKNNNNIYSETGEMNITYKGPGEVDVELVALKREIVFDDYSRSITYKSK